MEQQYNKAEWILPDNLLQVGSELAAWIFFLVMLGELAWSEADKAKILDVYGIKE